MTRLSLAELETRCQKPDHRGSGNWMARRISRPAALRITWIVHPWGISAHAMTVLALVCAIAAAAAFARGDVSGWLAGAALLQLWYLLDHVDGQLARLHGAATLDGMQLDYLMHHVVNLLIPWGVGVGVMQTTDAAGWMVLGLIWSLGLLLLGLANDTRYKAFVGRLKQLDGPLLVIPGEKPKSSFAPAGSPGPCARPLDAGQAGHKGRDYLALSRTNALVCSVHAARKFCEIHVVMNSLAAIALVQFAIGKIALGQWYLAVAAPLAVATAVATLARDIQRGAAEQEFAQWYRAGRQRPRGALPPPPCPPTPCGGPCRPL